MEEYKEKWTKCLKMIRTNYKEGEKYDRWFKVWFGDVKAGQYNPNTNLLLLTVPSNYVIEYIETQTLKVFREALRKVFGDDVKVQYLVLPPEPTFEQMARYMQNKGNNLRRNPGHIHVANARQRLEEGLRYFLNGKPVKWLKGYDSIVEWLTDNKGRGLLVLGAPGLGKSLICQKVLPYLIGIPDEIKCVNARQLHDRLKELEQERIVIIDDLGKEPPLHYGNRDQSFYELCDHAERTKQLLIITTNLATGVVKGHPLPPEFSDSIQHRYGDAVFSRMTKIVKSAYLVGEDMRGK